jgi:dTDP-4-amino-4,6-dideoxygalactose transaminase
MGEAAAKGKPAILGGVPVRTRPFPSWPVFGQEEEENLLEVLHSGKWWNGEKARAFEERFAAFQGARHGVACSCGTVAIQLALTALGLRPGDEVLVPAYTFIASATAVLAAGGVPVFVDVLEDTANMDPDDAAQRITKKTRAIVVVHFAGLPADMDRILDLARKRGLAVVEDAAHAWGSRWRGTGAGALGSMGTFSFQMSKNITAGEGGILLTQEKELAALARSLSDCGRVEGRPWYEHHRAGGNFRMTEFQAAVLLAQLGRLDGQVRLRERNARVLDERLAQIPGIRVAPRDPSVTQRSYHLHLFRYEASAFGGLPRGRFLEALAAEGIPCFPGYPTPVYGTRCFQDLEHLPGCREVRLDYRKVSCPVAERLCREEMVWLEHRLLLGDERDMRDIADAVRKIHAHREALR